MSENTSLANFSLDSSWMNDLFSKDKFIDGITGSLQNGYKPAEISLSSANNSGTPLFDPNNSFMDNAGQVLGLAGGVASLADVLNNWGVNKRMMKTNIANVQQQMANNQKAFDRSVARQDRSLAAVLDANNRPVTTG